MILEPRHVSNESPNEEGASLLTPWSIPDTESNMVHLVLGVVILGPASIVDFARKNHCYIQHASSACRTNLFCNYMQMSCVVFTYDWCCWLPRRGLLPTHHHQETDC